MNARRLENFLIFLIALGLALVIYVILYHPEWLLWFFTYRG